MRYKRIADEFYGTPAQREEWKKRLEDERKRNQEAMRAYKLREELRRQLTLPLGLPPIVLCPSCHGLGCKDCNRRGVVQEEAKKISPPCMLEGQPSVSRTVECRRCWGVGQIASTKFIVRPCPDCDGTGRVEAPID